MLNRIIKTDDTTYNPFGGLHPSFGPFQPLFESKLDVFLSLTWLACMAFAGFHLATSLAQLAKSRGGYGDQMAEARRDLLMSSVAIVGLASLGAIYAILVKA